MIADPLAEGYDLKLVEVPEPNQNSMKKCRELCKQNTCGAYNVTWSCPPGIGSINDCLAQIDKYKHGLTIFRKFDVDLENKELVKKYAVEHQEIVRRFANLLRKNGYDVLPLADGGCTYAGCDKCTYPDEPCRYPEMIVPSISAFGILMGNYMESQGIEFTFEKNAMTLYGVILYNRTR